MCWGGVYHCSRAFVPLLVASDDAYLVNTSSVNGFWACLGPGIPHTAYSAAKFAVKGFSEALVTDFRVNAPHVKVAVVMPGHIGTGDRHQHLADPRAARSPRTWTTSSSPRHARAASRQGVPLDGVDGRAAARRADDDGRGASATTRRCPRPRRRPSSSTACAPTRGASSSATTRDALDEAVRADPLAAYDGGINLPTLRTADPTHPRLVSAR